MSEQKHYFHPQPIRLGVLDLLNAAPNVEQTWVNDEQTIAFRMNDGRFGHAFIIDRPEMKSVIYSLGGQPALINSGGRVTLWP